MAERRRKLAEVLFKLTVAILLLELASFLAMLFLAGERDPVRSETHLFDPHRNHRLNPAFPLHSKDGFRRDKPVSHKKPLNTIRVIALGTSALYGIGSNAPYPKHRSLHNDETISYQLERILNEKLITAGSNYDVEVVNAGVSAYRTFHHVMYLKAELIDYEPDIVINIDGHNDFYTDRLEDPWNRYTYSSSVLVDQFNRRTMFLPIFSFTRSLAKYSYAFNLGERICRRVWYRTLNKPLKSVPDKPFQLDGEFDHRVRKAARRQYVLDLWQIHQLGAYVGFDHYVFLQPEVVFESNEELGDSDKRAKQITLDNMESSRAEKMRKIRALLPAIFAEHRIPFFDVAELSLDNKNAENLYLDYCHLTPAGAKIAARRIAVHLGPRVLERIAKRKTAEVDGD